MGTVLQLIAGIFYLLNKIFLNFSEKSNEKTAQRWRIAAWIVYLVGLPAWVIIFIIRHNWIAASVEASGVPAMVLGLVMAIKGTTKDAPRWLDNLAIFCIPLGFGFSIYDFGGITTLNQVLEITMVVGFLVGTYLLAKKKPGGYLWYVLMNISCAYLMRIQGYPWLFLQQCISLFFVGNAYITTQRNRRT